MNHKIRNIKITMNSFVHMSPDCHFRFGNFLSLGATGLSDKRVSWKICLVGKYYLHRIF